MTHDDRPTASRDAVCRVLTGSGKAAIAVVELSGKDSREVLESCFETAVSSRELKPGQVRYGRWARQTLDESDSGESIVVVPESDDRFEIHCHGGIAAVDRIINDMLAEGATKPDADENGGTPERTDDWLRAEAERTLIRCAAKQPAAIALDQYRGAMHDWCKSAIQLLDDAHQNVGQVAQQASTILAARNVGTRLHVPFDIVLAGPPNVGKSSLINAIVGYERSIATKLAGTTRDVLDADTVLEGWPVRLRDTAGLHASNDVIESEGIRRAQAAIDQADLLVCVSQPGHESNEDLRQLQTKTEKRIPVLDVLNKADLAAPNPVAPEVRYALRTVATQGDGIVELIHAMVQVLTRDIPEPGKPVPLSQPQVAWLQKIAEARDADRQLACLLEALASQS
ncbi:MAG: GTPase [Planctomycetota bacterium]